MGAAESARLISTLEMQDKGFTRTADKAQRSLSGLEKSNNRIASSNTRTGRSFVNMGAGIGRAQGNLGNFIKSGAGLLGLGLGIAGITKALTGTIDAAAEFGANVTKVQKVTGLSAATASAMVDTLDKWGVAGDRIIPMLGRMEKNVGALAVSHKKAAEFQKKFGINLLDSNGKIADANTLLLRSADYWNSNASATDKAVVMSKLWGKAWQDLIPILSKGSGFIKAQEKDAIHLTATQIRNINKFRDAQREFADITGDVAVKIGAELMPAITDVIRPLGAWLDTHSDDIAKFFKDGVAFAKEMGAAVQNYVVPALDTIGKAWNSIPAELRQLIVGGIVANKVLKMTIGFDPLDIVRKGFTDTFKSVLGIKAGIVNVSGGIVNGGVGGVGGVGGKLGAAASVLGPVAIAVAAGAAVGIAWKRLVQDPALDKQQAGVEAAAAKQRSGFLSPEAWQTATDALKKGIADIEALPFGKELYAGQYESLKRMLDQYNKQGPSYNSAGYKGFEGRGAGYRPADAVMATTQGFQKMLAATRQLHDDFVKQYGLLKTSRDPAVVAAAATKTAADVAKGAGSVKTTKDVIATLKQQLAATKDPALRKVLTEALRKVERKLPGREWIAAQKDAATKIAKSNESVGEKVRDLKKIQADLLSHGDTAAANIVGALLNSVVPAINAINIRNTVTYLTGGTGTSRPNPSGPQNRPDVKPEVLPKGHKNPDRNQNRPSIQVSVSHRNVQTAADHKTRYTPDRQG